MSLLVTGPAKVSAHKAKRTTVSAYTHGYLGAGLIVSLGQPHRPVGHPKCPALVVTIVVSTTILKLGHRPVPAQGAIPG